MAIPVLQIDPRGWIRSIDWTTVIDLGVWFSRLAEILLIVFLAWLSSRALRLLLKRLERSARFSDAGTVSLQEQRVATLLSLVRSVGLAIIGLITLFMLLTALGLQIGPLLAGAGVAGLAISFGAQSLVRDIISGLFILLENQFGVGDVVRVGDVSGKVEKMTLRIVVLRDVHGALHIVPNGEITRVSNLTRSFSRAVIDVSIPFSEDSDRVMRVMQSVGDELWGDPQWRPLLIEQPTVPGIESFADAAVHIRVMATTLPLKQWDVARELRIRLKRRFDEEKIQMTSPTTTLFWGPDQQPVPARGTDSVTGLPERVD